MRFHPQIFLRFAWNSCPLHEILEMVRPLSDPYGSASVGTVVLELLSAFDGEGRVEFF